MQRFVITSAKFRSTGSEEGRRRERASEKTRRRTESVTEQTGRRKGNFIIFWLKNILFLQLFFSACQRRSGEEEIGRIASKTARVYRKDEGIVDNSGNSRRRETKEIEGRIFWIQKFQIKFFDFRLEDNAAAIKRNSLTIAATSDFNRSIEKNRNRENGNENRGIRKEENGEKGRGMTFPFFRIL